MNIKQRRKDINQLKVDEFFTNGKLELGRIGNLVSVKNHYSQEEIDERNQKMAADYDIAKADINALVDKIKTNLSKCNPLMVLQAATDVSMMQLLRTVSESQLSPEQSNNLRLIEYIQSLLISQEDEEENISDEEEQTRLMFQIFSDIEELYNKCQMFVLIWAAKKQVDKAYTLEEIEYIVEAQLMSNVRGNRYQFQQLRDIEKLLMPHSEKLKEVYGVTADELLFGLKKLEYSLSSAKLDAVKGIMKSFEEFQKKSENLTTEETDQVLQSLQNDEDLHNLFSKSFGTELYEVKKVTGWPDSLVDKLSWKVGENKDLFTNTEYSGWPIQDLPVQKKPFIKINGTVYCFDYYNLFDNIYRIIQKNIREYDENYVNEWSMRQQEASEELVAEKFRKLLPDAEVFVGNYYPKGKSLKQLDENDVLIVYDDAVIVVEVKAGSFTYTPAITDYDAHKKSFQALIEKADFQCIRTLEYIRSHSDPVFYYQDKTQKTVIHSKSIRKYFSICVTVDNFNVFEAKIEKNKFFSMNSGTIAISLDDLDAYVEYFDSALCFMHYLKHREQATKVECLKLNDELDHLGLYISKNAYEDYVADFSDCNSFVANGFREDIDAYFAGLYNDQLKINKPVQIIPEYMGRVLSFLETNKTTGRLKFAEFLLDMCYESREQFDEGIKNKITREKQLGYVSPFWVEGDFAYCCFVRIPGVDNFQEKLRRLYTYANMKDRRWNECWEISVDFNSSNEIERLRYADIHYNNYSADGFTEKEISSYMSYIRFGRQQQGIKLPSSRKNKIYPNDLCPCGSGKKYKKCCGKK